MTPPRAEIVTFCVATLVIVGGAVGLLLSSGRGQILMVVLAKNSFDTSRGH
jgi:hypothetical protein